MMNKSDSKVLLDRLLNEGIKPHAKAIAEIVTKGEIAVAIWEPRGDAEQMARGLGWTGEGVVFQMSSAGRKKLIENLENRDPVTVRWLKGGRSGRIFVISGEGTLLVNFEEGKGFSIEPGSTDAEYLS